MTAEAIGDDAAQPAPAKPDLVPTFPPSRLRLCVCGHEADTHEHYRGGNDCGVCGCRYFRRHTRRGVRSLFRW